MENAYRDLLGQCINLVKVFTKNKYKERYLPQKKAKAREESIPCVVKKLLLDIEDRISSLSSQPNAETSCPIIKVIKKYNLDATERTILYYFLGSRIIGFEESSMERISEFLAGEEPGHQVEMMVTHFHPGSKIMQEGIITRKDPPFREYSLSPNIYQQIVQNLLPEPTKDGQKGDHSKSDKESGEKEKEKEVLLKKAPLPRETYAALDKYVIGQNEAKTALSIAVHRHYHQLLTPEGKISPSNILMVGPTGVGKTYLIRTLAAFLQVPVAFVSANEFTETGYVGRSVGDIIGELHRKAGGSRKKAEQGIIFIDEIDKLAERGSAFGHNSNRDVSGRSVQEELLDLLESSGSRKVSFGKHLNREVECDTSRILFIAAGAFNGLDQIVKENCRQKGRIGFIPTKTSLSSLENTGSSIDPANLERYGLIPELLGRFSVICSLAPLSEDNLTHIMVEPKDSLLEEFQGYFRSFGVEVKFKKEATKEIAKIAMGRGTGARGLRSVLEAVLQPHFFKLENNNGGQLGKRIIIDEKAVLCCLKTPVFVDKPKAAVCA